MFYGAVTVGERGQIVIPAEARKTLDLKHGDKLLVFRSAHGPGLVLARLEDMRALMDELQKWESAVAEAVSASREESEIE
jgi:AbrB family looped-hinge helix DNA binding protein